MHTLASFPGSSAPERDIEVVHACLFRVPESLGTRLCAHFNCVGVTIDNRAIECFIIYGVTESHFCSHTLSFATVAMAVAPDPVEKGLEELEEGLEDEITCPVCQEHFRDPKILPCLHYYCKECVRQLALRAGPNRPFACPECRRGTVLPQNDPDQLPTVFFVNRRKEH